MLTDGTKESNSSQIPPTLLTVGSLCAKAFQWISNIDFLLSARSDNFNLMYKILIDWGTWVFFAAGLIWFLWRLKNPTSKEFWPAITVVTGMLAFVWGVLVTIHATGMIPKVITAWGGARLGECNATFDTSGLSSFHKDYHVVLICGVVDPKADQFTDTRITISKPYTILPRDPIKVSVPFNARMANAAQQIPVQDLFIWNVAVIVPKGADISSINSLSDVKKNDGKILSPDYYDY